MSKDQYLVRRLLRGAKGRKERKPNFGKAAIRSSLVLHEASLLEYNTTVPACRHPPIRRFVCATVIETGECTTSILTLGISFITHFRILCLLEHMRALLKRVTLLMGTATRKAEEHTLDRMPSVAPSSSVLMVQAPLASPHQAMRNHHHPHHATHANIYRPYPSTSLRHN